MPTVLSWQQKCKPKPLLSAFYLAVCTMLHTAKYNADNNGLAYTFVASAKQLVQLDSGNNYLPQRYA